MNAVERAVGAFVCFANWGCAGFCLVQVVEATSFATFAVALILGCLNTFVAAALTSILLQDGTV